MNYPTAQEIARRYVQFAPARAPRYEQGVRNPVRDWEKETADAEPNYEKGVQDAIKRKAFGKGVKKCGTERQKSQTIKNITRWAEGIEGAEDVMAAAMESVSRVAQAIVLPPAYPKGDKRNYLRSEAVGTALRKAKEDGRI